MDEYSISATDTFKKVYASLDTSEKNWIEKIKRQLRINPTGKILQFGWFREKKFHNKRLFYLLDNKNKKVLLVAFASKKEQQKIINFVISNKDELFNLLQKFS